MSDYTIKIIKKPDEYSQHAVTVRTTAHGDSIAGALGEAMAHAGASALDFAYAVVFWEHARRDKVENLPVPKGHPAPGYDAAVAAFVQAADVLTEVIDAHARNPSASQ